jgi:hypothetical protein
MGALGHNQSLLRGPSPRAIPQRWAARSGVVQPKPRPLTRCADPTRLIGLRDHLIGSHTRSENLRGQDLILASPQVQSEYLVENLLHGRLYRHSRGGVIANMRSDLYGRAHRECR